MSTLNWGDLIKDAGEISSSYEALPDGDYDLTVIEATAKVTQSGKTMFSIKTQVEGGAYNKRFVWDNLTVSPENKNVLFKLLWKHCKKLSICLHRFPKINIVHMSANFHDVRAS